MTATCETIAFLGPLGPAELGIILFIVVLLFGAKKLPQLARSMGKSMGEFKRGRQEFESELKLASEGSEKATEETATEETAGQETEEDSKRSDTVK